MEVRPGYKQTEVGVIPEDWERVQLTTVAQLESGHTPSRRNPRYWNGEIPWVSLHDTDSLDESEILTTKQKVTQAGIDNSSARLLPKGTVVFSRTATVGKTTVLGRDMATSQDFANYICGPRIYNHFLVYLFRFMAPEWKRLMAGSIHNTVYMPVFQKLRVTLPPREEQELVVAALLDVDALLAKLDQLIAKKRDLKQAAMQQLLTGQTRLPGFSGEWGVKRMGEVADLLKGGGLSKDSVAASGRRKCILYGELFTTYGQVILDVVGRTNSQDGRLSVAGDVLVPGSTTTDGVDLATASALLEEGVALGGDINIIRCKDANTFDARFLANYLTHVKRREIAERAQGTTIVHLYGRDLSDLSVQRPDLAEQVAIATVFSDLDAEIATLESRHDKTRALKQGMMQELLTGRIRLV